VLGLACLGQLAAGNPGLAPLARGAAALLLSAALRYGRACAGTTAQMGCCGLLPLLLQLSSAATPPAIIPASVNVISNGMLGFPTYRGGKVLQLPQHGSRSGSAPLLVTGCGRRPGGGDAGCRSVVMRRSLNGGQTFDAPRVVANASQLVWNGVILDGIYDGAYVHDAWTNTTLMHWGQCIEQCRPVSLQHNRSYFGMDSLYCLVGRSKTNTWRCVCLCGG
jgi:hypothetical protein